MEISVYEYVWDVVAIVLELLQWGTMRNTLKNKGHFILWHGFEPIMAAIIQACDPFPLLGKLSS